jgi:hypothetical protein
VARAFDLEGVRRAGVRTDRVGTRHRSAYRLCHEVRDAVVILVSQDGGMRFVRWHDGAVTYWDQVATGPWELREEIVGKAPVDAACSQPISLWYPICPDDRSTRGIR